jgi:hypothetical protein
LKNVGLLANRARQFLPVPDDGGNYFPVQERVHYLSSCEHSIAIWRAICSLIGDRCAARRAVM